MVEVYEDLLVVGHGLFAPHVWQNKPSVGTITPRKFVIGILGNSSFKIFIICCKEESDYALEFPGVALCPTISSRKNNPFLSKMQPLKSFELFEFNLRVQEAKNNTDFFCLDPVLRRCKANSL